MDKEERKIEISIIVPVYNVEKYLNKCIDSILAQTFKNFELILIDDGSPDNCGKICDEYALKDSRVKVIHKNNGGISSARNAGLDIAQGEYIGFVDSDDWIEPDMYEVLYKLIKEGNKDIANIGFTAIYPQKKDCWTKHHKKILNKEEALSELLMHQLYGNYFWANLYSSKIFANIRFEEGIIFEDIDLLYRVMSKSNGIVTLGRSKYNYCQHQFSTVTNFFKNINFKMWELLDIYYKREIFFKKNYKDIYLKVYNRLYNKSYFYLGYDILVNTIENDNFFSDSNIKIIKIIRAHFLKNMFLNIDLKTKFRLILLQFSIKLFKISFKKRKK